LLRAASRFITRLAAIAIAGGLAVVTTAPAASAEARGPWPGRAPTATAVYSQTNATTGNAVLVYRRQADGQLSPAGSVPTGGNGSGAGLGSGHSVVVSDSGRVVLVVNAGSNSVSALAWRGSRLLQAGAPVSAAGADPTSVTIHGHLVYVMNAGSGTISGFWLTRRLGLIPIAGSTQALAAAGTATDSQIQFSRDGRVLIVDERAPVNVIQTFTIGPDGAAQPAATVPADAGGPFGFDVDPAGHVLFSNAALGTSSGASSYDVSDIGALTPNGPPVSSGQAAACWLAAVASYAYTDNAGSGSIGRFAVSSDGALSLTGTTVISPGAHPLDMAAAGGEYLYVLANGLSEIIGYRVTAAGQLAQVTEVPVPAGSIGLGAS